MSEEEGQQEPSMEEILASIRKIISEDEEEAPEEAEASEELVEEAMEEGDLEPEPEAEIVEESESGEESDPVLVDDNVDGQSETPEDDEELELLDEVEEEEVEFGAESGPVLEAAPVIVSDPTAQAGVDAFGQLAGIIAGRMQLGQGRTVEELVQELLRPLLQEWLDKNLPELVEELVKKEIERMVQQANR